ncbi:hypothetical protein WDW37_14125 [Bdellovibrionota bacterium FG-1]
MKNNKNGRKIEHYSFRRWLKKLKQKIGTQKMLSQFLWFLAKLVLFYLDHQ